MQRVLQVCQGQQVHQKFTQDELWAEYTRVCHIPNGFLESGSSRERHWADQLFWWNAFDANLMTVKKDRASIYQASSAIAEFIIDFYTKWFVGVQVQNLTRLFLPALFWKKTFYFWRSKWGDSFPLKSIRRDESLSWIWDTKQIFGTQVQLRLNINGPALFDERIVLRQRKCIWVI